jgi:hypothetical protein
MKPEPLRQLPQTLFGLLQRGFSNALTPKEETFLWLGLVAIWFIGIYKMVAELSKALLSVSGFLHLADPLSNLMLVALMAFSGLTGLFFGGIAVVLWFTGRDLRRRGGLWASAPITGSSIPAE